MRGQPCERCLDLNERPIEIDPHDRQSGPMPLARAEAQYQRWVCRVCGAVMTRKIEPIDARAIWVFGSGP